MAETSIEVRPFWLQDASSDERSVLQKVPSDAVSVGELKKAVPKLSEAKHDNVLIEYTSNDGLLAFHIYLASRKKLLDETLPALEKAGYGMLANDIIKLANAELAKTPWPADAGKKISQVFHDHFPQQPMKINFYPEVDSWSVVMPAPTWDTTDPQRLAIKLAGLFKS